VLQAQALALKACRAGITCRELDLVARKFIEDKGFGKQFGHGLGHGTGLQVHELPTVSFSEDRVLQEGMVITIEPGVYLDGIGGVRIEDMVLIKDGGYENMYNDDKSLLII
jgi:Xaa-Pro aminopeptidase